MKLEIHCNTKLYSTGNFTDKRVETLLLIAQRLQNLEEKSRGRVTNNDHTLPKAAHEALIAKMSLKSQQIAK